MTFDDIRPASNADVNQWAARDLTERSAKLQKAEKTASTSNKIWKPISHALFSLIPFGIGNLISPAVDAGSDAAANAHAKQETDKINKDRKLLGMDQVESHFDVTNKNSIDQAVDLSKILKKKPLLTETNSTGTPLVHPWITQMASMPTAPKVDVANSIQTDPAQNTDNPNAPAVTSGGAPIDINTDSGGGFNLASLLGGLSSMGGGANGGGGGNETIETTPSSGNMDWNSGGDAPATPGIMRKGGTVKGPTHENGGTQLIKNGKALGLEVEVGERIVPEDEWNMVLGHLKGGRSRKALALLEDIEHREPEQGEFGSGGTVKKKVPVPDNISKLTDAELAAMAGSPRLTPKEMEAVSAEIKNRGFEATSTGFLEAGDPKRTGIGDVTLYKPGQDYEKTKVRPDGKFNYDQWRKGLGQVTENYGLLGMKPVGLDFDPVIPPTKKTIATGGGGTGKKPRGKETLVDALTTMGASNGIIEPMAGVDKIDKSINTTPNGSNATSEVTADGAGTKPDVGNILSNVGGTAFDAMRLGMGLIGADKKLQDFEPGSEWTNYLNKARYFSNVGLTPEEKALANSTEQNNYGQAVQNITNASGGNAGAIMGNLSAVNAGRGAYALALAAKDAELKQKNFQNFLPILNEDIGFKKDTFDRHYNQDLATKQAGATLASDAISNIKSRIDDNRFYGPGSAYDKFNNELIAKGASEAEILKAQADYWKNPTNYIATRSTPYDYHKYMTA